MDNQLTVFKLGRAIESLDTSFLGMTKTFTFKDPNTNHNCEVPGTYSGYTLKATLVQSTINTAVPAGRLVNWGTGTDDIGHLVAALSGANEIAAGFVDPFVRVTAVPDNYYFWLVTQGYTLVAVDTSAILKGSVLVTGATGSATLQTAAPADATACLVQANARVGIAIEANGGTATTDTTTNTRSTTLRQALVNIQAQFPA